MANINDTQNIKLGVCKIFSRKSGTTGVYEDYGYTQGGVEFTVATETHKVNVDQYGKTVVKEIIMSRDVKIKVPLAETTLENMIRIMPGASKKSGTGVETKTVATFNIKNALTGAATEALVIGGVTFNLKAMGATAGPADTTTVYDVIPTAATAASLTAMLKTKIAASSLNTTWDTATVTGSTTITMTSKTAGATYTLPIGETPSVDVVTVVGLATTSSATNVVVVSTGVGRDLIVEDAYELLLRPKDKDEAATLDTTEDLVVFRAATAGAMNFSYTVDKERIFNVEFTAYPDDSLTGSPLFKFGDSTITI